MAKKALLIGGGIAIALAIGGGFIALPYFTNRADEAADRFIAMLNSSGHVEVTHGEKRFSVWGAGFAIDDIVVTVKDEQLPLVFRADTFEANDINVVSLLTGDRPADPEATIRALSVSQARIPTLRVEYTAEGAETPIEFVMNDVTIEDLANGVARKFFIAQSTFSAPEKLSAEFPESVRYGRVEYNDLNIALYANVFSDTPSNELMSFVSSASADAVEFRMNVTLSPGEEAVADIKYGPMRAGAMQIRPAAFAEMISAIQPIMQASRENRGPESEEEFAALRKMLRVYGDAMTLESMTIDAMTMAFDETQNANVSIGPITLTNWADGAIGDMSAQDIRINVEETADINIGKYGIRNFDFQTLLDFMSTSLGPDMENLTPEQIATVLPHFEIYAENVNITAPEVGDIKIGRYNLTLSGERGEMPGKFSYEISGIDVPIPDDSPLVAARTLGMESIAGDIGIVLAYDKDARNIRIERLGMDVAKVGAVNVTGSAADVDLLKLISTGSEHEALASLEDARIEEIRIEIDDREGGLERLFGLAALAQGKDAASYKAELDMMLQMFAPAFLGEAAESVTPVLTSFLEDPKALTLTVRAKDETMSILAMVIALQMSPDLLPSLLTIEAAAE